MSTNESQIFQGLAAPGTEIYAPDPFATIQKRLTVQDLLSKQALNQQALVTAQQAQQAKADELQRGLQSRKIIADSVSGLTSGDDILDAIENKAVPTLTAAGLHKEALEAAQAARAIRTGNLATEKENHQKRADIMTTQVMPYLGGILGNYENGGADQEGGSQGLADKINGLRQHLVSTGLVKKDEPWFSESATPDNAYAIGKFLYLHGEASTPFLTATAALANKQAENSKIQQETATSATQATQNAAAAGEATAKGSLAGKQTELAAQEIADKKAEATRRSDAQALQYLAAAKGEVDYDQARQMMSSGLRAMFPSVAFDPESVKRAGFMLTNPQEAQKMMQAATQERKTAALTALLAHPEKYPDVFGQYPDIADQLPDTRTREGLQTARGLLPGFKSEQPWQERTNGDIFNRETGDIIKSDNPAYKDEIEFFRRDPLAYTKFKAVQAENKPQAGGLGLQQVTMEGPDGKPLAGILNLRTGHVTPATGEGGAAIIPAAKAGSASDQANFKLVQDKIDAARKPVSSGLESFSRLTDILNQGTPITDKLIAPEAIKALVGGAGSGLRITQAELSTIAPPNRWDQIKLALNKWSLDSSKALSLDPQSRKDLQAIVDLSAKKLAAKQAVLGTAERALSTIRDVLEQRAILARMNGDLDRIDSDYSGFAKTGPTVGTAPASSAASSGELPKPSNPGHVGSDQVIDAYIAKFGKERGLQEFTKDGWK